MELLFACLTLLVCLGVVWFASRRTITYAVRTAYLFDVSPFFIAFTILSLATGLPELIIAIHSLLIKQPLLSAGAIIGSNFVDVALILGIPAVCAGPIISHRDENRRHIALTIVCILLMGTIFFLQGLNFVGGVMLILFYALCLVWFWHTRKLGYFEPSPLLTALKNAPNQFVIRLKAIGMIFVSVGIMIIAARLSVQSALIVADGLGVGAGLIGATIVALGTSLPELSVTWSAVKKKEYSLAIGSALGSVLEQGSFILGIVGIFSDRKLDFSSLLSLAPFLLLSYCVVAYGLIWRKSISRMQGWILIGLYVAYVIIQFR